jgi:hypothetical protein
MTTGLARALPALFAAIGGLACGADPPLDEPPVCESANPAAAFAPPAGARSGEPYRWLSRSWTSPLGLTVRTYGVAVDGIPIYGRHQVEISDPRNRLVHRAGTGDAVLARLHDRGASAWAAWRHPLAGRAPRASAETDRSRPLAHALVHTAERAVWHYAHGDLVAAVLTERVDLLGDAPVGEAVLRDAATGAELARRRTIYDLAEPEYLVYARDDGRPLCSPLGDTFPHPTGVPDGVVPPLVVQQLRRQSEVVDARSDPWLPASATHTRGNNVVAFFNSLLDPTGKRAELFDDTGDATPEFGPEPDPAGHDFFAAVAGGKLAFRYDPTRSVSEYFQDGPPGTSMAPPDPRDTALNAKIVAAFYAANWLHDFFYSAGFDELAGNAQQSNLGRGGIACDPLIIHAGFNDTFTFPTADGESPVLDLGLNIRSASRRDASMDFTVLAHEWGHYLIGRLVRGAGDGDALGTLQGQALHEGIADFVGVLVNLSTADLQGGFAVGSYDNLDYLERRPVLPAGEATADAMYYGIRRYPYSLDVHKNPLSFRNLVEPPPVEIPFYNWKGRGPLLSEPHTTGELFSEALFQCFGNILAAHPGVDFERLRARMAQYLVAGLSAFPDHPSLLDARNAVLAVIRLVAPTDDYPACRAGFAARGMGADALGPDREFGGADLSELPPYDPAQVEESMLDRDRALRLISSGFIAAASGDGTGTLRVELRNTGVVELTGSSLAISPDVAGAVGFPGGSRVDLPALAPEQAITTAFAVALDTCQLPPDPSQPGFRTFDYTVTASADGAPVLSRTASYHVAVPEGPSPCASPASSRSP